MVYLPATSVQCQYNLHICDRTIDNTQLEIYQLVQQLSFSNSMGHPQAYLCDMGEVIGNLALVCT